MIKVSVGVIAYNEESNLSFLLDSLLNQKLKQVNIKEIFIVSSGSTDDTNSIAKRYARKHKKIKLITQKKRSGKASAVNLFMSRSTSEILILMSADLILKPETVENLIAPFKKKSVGITGVHPIPVNNPNTLMGFASHLLWNMHHKLSLKYPKMGEMIAFRKVFKQIPVLSAVDEVNIEALIRGQGLKRVYVQKAIVFNKGPESIKDFLNVRRRVYAGHLSTKKEYSYEVSTMNSLHILQSLLSSFKVNWQFLVFTIPVILLEVYARFLGWKDYTFKTRDHTVWEVAKSTKDLKPYVKSSNI